MQVVRTLVAAVLGRRASAAASAASLAEEAGAAARAHRTHWPPRTGAAAGASRTPCSALCGACAASMCAARMRNHARSTADATVLHVLRVLVLLVAALVVVVLIVRATLASLAASASTSTSPGALLQASALRGELLGMRMPPTPLRRTYATMLSSIDYAAGVLVLAHTLARAGCAHPLLVVCVRGRAGVSNESAALVELASLPNVRIAWVDPLWPRDLGAASERWAINWSKLRVWQMHDAYDQIALLDADMLVLRNIDDVFAQPERIFRAAPDWCRWVPPTVRKLNTGFIVVRPHADVFDALVRAMDDAVDMYATREAEQGFLEFFFGAAFVDLPHTVNAQKTLARHYPALWDWSALRVVHYTANKPWHEWTPHEFAHRNLDAPTRDRLARLDLYSEPDYYAPLTRMWRDAFFEARALHANALVLQPYEARAPWQFTEVGERTSALHVPICMTEGRGGGGGDGGGDDAALVGCRVAETHFARAEAGRWWQLRDVVGPFAHADALLAQQHVADERAVRALLPRLHGGDNSDVGGVGHVLLLGVGAWHEVEMGAWRAGVALDWTHVRTNPAHDPHVRRTLYFWYGEHVNATTRQADAVAGLHAAVRWAAAGTPGAASWSGTPSDGPAPRGLLVLMHWPLWGSLRTFVDRALDRVFDVSADDSAPALVRDVRARRCHAYDAPWCADEARFRPCGCATRLVDELVRLWAHENDLRMVWAVDNGALRAKLA